MHDAWTRLLERGDPIPADGAMGTMLFAAGLQFGDPPEVWNVDHPEAVRAVHRAYIEAGSNVILTNTFGGNRFRLALHGRQDHVAELDTAAARLLREEADAAMAADPGRIVVVAGDIGPTGAIMAAYGGELTRESAHEAFREQAAALAAGGADVIWIETMSDLAEVTAAVEGAKAGAPGLPIIATMSFDTRGRTMMGVTPEAAAATLLDLGVAAVGGNCGNGPDELVPVIEKMRAAHPDAILVAKANAGIPQLVGTEAKYLMTPDTLAEFAARFRAAGATVVGACCGSSPEHLAAMHHALTA
jgi:methionine synthase I (cobalamin-dependent)